MDTYLIESCVLPACLKSLESANYKDLDPDANRNRRHMEAIYLHYAESETSRRGWTASEAKTKVVSPDEGNGGLVVLGEQFGYVEAVKGAWDYSNWRKCPDDDEWVFRHAGTFEAMFAVRSAGWPPPPQSTMVSVGSMQPGQRHTTVYDGVTPDFNEYHFEPVEGCRLLPPRPFAIATTPRWQAFQECCKERERLRYEAQKARFLAGFDRLYRAPEPRPCPWFLRPLLMQGGVRRLLGLRQPAPPEPPAVAPPAPAPEPEPVLQEMAPEPPVTGYPCRLYVTIECNE